VTYVINRKMLGTVCLAIATFLNPFGFDILVYKLTQLTNDYWSTMYVLYASAALFFGFSYLSFKIGKKAIGNLLLTLALFLNPLGYDIVVYGITQLTNDYWMTMSVMYMLAGSFFALFMYLYDINPIKAFSYHAKKTHNKLKKNKNENI
jgi:hypothetical protein